MGYRTLLLAVALASLPLALLAQEGTGISIDEMTFCTAVQDRAPAGVDTAFASTVENVFCFTKVRVAETVAVTHVWYFGEKEMARVELAVNGSPWRTWSSKRIIPEWQGRWRVDVLSPAGEVVKSAAFVIRP